MKRLLTPLRHQVEKLPLVAESYRLLRDHVTFRRATPRDLPQGFKLMGEERRIGGNYEPAQTQVITDVLASSDVFVDVGANIGYYTCLARVQGRQVIAFEPSTTTVRFLYANLLANDLRDVEVLPVGLSDEVDLATFYGTGGTASLIPGWSRASAAYATVIPTTTLDRVLAGRFLDERVFVKIDIEGGEYRCLRGATETLARELAPAWFVEIYLQTAKGHRNEDFAATFALFFDHGYVARVAEPDGASITRAQVEGWARGDGEPPKLANYLFTKPR